MLSHWTPEQANRHRAALRRELGPEVLAALEDPEVTEILLNPDGRLWTEHRTQGLQPTGSRMEPRQARGLLATVAGLLGLVIGEARPILEAELPLDGSRIEGLLPPIVEAPAFAIRKRAAVVIPLAGYVAGGAVTEAQARTLRQALGERRNILVSGGPGSGKTTFCNALIHALCHPDSEVQSEVPSISESPDSEVPPTSEMPTNERLVILEDTYELRSEAPNTVILHTTEEVSLRTLVATALRLRPDRILVGEVRGPEAYDLLKAWNTGNPGGLATLHANSALDALERLDQLVQEAGVPSQSRLIARTVGLVAHLERRGSLRHLAELATVGPLDSNGGFTVFDSLI